MWIHDMFGTEKPIIALLHLDALPGDPGFAGVCRRFWSMPGLISGHCKTAE